MSGGRSPWCAVGAVEQGVRPHGTQSPRLTPLGCVRGAQACACPHDSWEGDIPERDPLKEQGASVCGWRERVGGRELGAGRSVGSQG